MRKAIAILSIIILFSVSLYADRYSKEISKTEKQLSKLKEKLSTVQKEYKSLKKQEKEILKLLATLDEEISLTSKLLDQMKYKEELINRKIKYLKMETEYLENKLKERKKILSERLRIMYKYSNKSPVEIFLTAKSFNDIYNQLKYMTILARQDKMIADEIEYLQKKIQKKEESLQISLKELEELKKELEKEYDKLQAEKSEKKDLLNSIKKKKDKQLKLAKELKESQKKLQAMINKLIEQRKKELEKTKQLSKISGKAFAKNKGKLPWPVKGKVISKFGTVIHEKYGTKTKNNGIDIKAKIGTPVYSVASGTVIYADRFLGYGNMILIDHGGGYYTMYAHLKDIMVDVNDYVTTYEQIGTVGETGSLSGSILHFEIRKNGKAINPLPWLKR